MFLVNIGIVGFIFIIIGCILVGGVVGFFIARHFIQKYLEKHPPITEKMIRAMMQQMGRTPSEKQVRQIMATMKQAK